MSWFKKKKNIQPVTSPTEIKIQKIYLEPTLDAYRAGVAILLTEYFYYLPLEDKSKISMIFSLLKPQISFVNMNFLEAAQVLDEKELLQVQKMVEMDYRITRH